MEITQQPIVQNNQLRFPAGNPQIELLATTPAQEFHTVEIDLPAKVVWNEEKTQRLFPAFPGRIAKIFVDIGQSVERGSPLAQVASPDFGTAQAETARALGEAVLAKKNLNRQKELFDAGVIAQKDYEGNIYKRIYELCEAHYDEIKAAKPKVSKNSGSATITVATFPSTILQKCPMLGSFKNQIKQCKCLMM